MKDTEKVVETVETNAEEVVENQSEGLLSKIAVTAGIIAVGLLGYALGSKSKKDDNNTDGIIDGDHAFASDDNTEE